MFIKLLVSSTMINLIMFSNSLRLYMVLNKHIGLDMRD